MRVPEKYQTCRYVKISKHFYGFKYLRLVGDTSGFRTIRNLLYIEVFAEFSNRGVRIEYAKRRKSATRLFATTLITFLHNHRLLESGDSYRCESRDRGVSKFRYEIPMT